MAPPRPRAPREGAKHEAGWAGKGAGARPPPLPGAWGLGPGGGERGRGPVPVGEPGRDSREEKRSAALALQAQSSLIRRDWMSREIRRDHRITLAAWAWGGGPPCPCPWPLAAWGGERSGDQDPSSSPGCPGDTSFTSQVDHRVRNNVPVPYRMNLLYRSSLNLYRVPCFCPLQVPRTPALSSCFLPLARACKGLHEGSEQT